MPGYAQTPKRENQSADSTLALLKSHVPPLPPSSFIDYVLSRKLADGVVLSGCSENACHNRFGIKWMQQRLLAFVTRKLRARVPRERALTVCGTIGRLNLRKESRILQNQLPRRWLPAWRARKSNVKRNAGEGRCSVSCAIQDRYWSMPLF